MVVSRRVGRHDLADHHLSEQVTQGGQTQLGGRRGSRPLQLLDVGRDMYALDRREPHHANRLKPIEEFRGDVPRNVEKGGAALLALSV
jgi:hypothetical protein